MSAKQAYSRMGFATLAFMVSWNVVVIAGTFIIIAIDKNLYSTNLVLLLNLLGEVCVGLPLFLLIARTVPGGPDKNPEMPKVKPSFIFKAIFGMFGVSIIGSIIASVINGFMSDTINVSSNSGLQTMFDNTFWIMAIDVIICAPIIEEFVMRKVLIDRVRCYGKKTAVIMSGVLFGLLHGNIEQFFYTFFVGMILAFVYVKTGKLRYSILIHCVLNTTSTVLQYCIMQLPIDDMDDMTKMTDAILKNDRMAIFFVIMTFIVIMEYVGGFVGLIMLFSNRKKFTFEESTVEASDTLNTMIETNQYAANDDETVVAEVAEEKFENYSTYGLVKERKIVKVREALFNLGMICCVLGLIGLAIIGMII